MKVAFHSRLLTERGSEGAMLDYARLNRSILGNDSVICLPDRPGFLGNPILKKWEEEFYVLFYSSKNKLGRELEKKGIEVLYLTKPGPWDGFLVPGVKNCIHAQFLCDEFHGDAYAYLSPWMSRVMTGREDSYVPFFVPKLESSDNLRKRLKIPAAARVFGRHGGWDTFNISFAQMAVTKHARRHPADHFVFLNTEPIPGTQRLANVHYLPATVDASEKARFLATCDAMLHARYHGETFGLAVGEFAVLGKPVITFGGSRERAHLEMLGASALIYHDERGLLEILKRVLPSMPFSTRYDEFTDACRVMQFFENNFLDGKG